MCFEATLFCVTKNVAMERGLRSQYAPNPRQCMIGVDFSELGRRRLAIVPAPPRLECTRGGISVNTCCAFPSPQDGRLFTHSLMFYRLDLPPSCLCIFGPGKNAETAGGEFEPIKHEETGVKTPILGAFEMHSVH